MKCQVHQVRTFLQSEKIVVVLVLCFLTETRQGVNVVLRGVERKSTRQSLEFRPVSYISCMYTCRCHWSLVPHFLHVSFFCPGAPELCDWDLSGGTVHPGPGAGREGDGGHLPRHAWPGGLWGAPGPAETVCLPLLPVLPHLLSHSQVREWMSKKGFTRFWHQCTEVFHVPAELWTLSHTDYYYTLILI